MDIEKAAERVKELLACGLTYQQSLQKVFHEFELTPFEFRRLKKACEKSIKKGAKNHD